MKTSNFTTAFRNFVAATAWSALAGSALANPSLATPANNLVLKVNGMVCSFCAQGIEKRLTALPQTASVYVNLAQKVVAVQAKPGQKFDSAKVKAEVVEAGFEVSAIDVTAKTTAQLKSELVAAKK